MSRQEPSHAMKIAYVLKGFPRLSESFIANEVRLLSAGGLNLHPFSIKAGDTLADRAGLPPITYLPPLSSMSGKSLRLWLRENLFKFSGTQRFWIARYPARYLSTLAFAFRCAWQYRRGRSLKKTFIREFLLASEIARQMISDGGYVHIHAHFCHDATTVAWMVSQLTRLPFSFTAHAKDIYQGSLNPGNLLERKLAGASFATTCTMANVDFLSNKTDKPEKIHGIYHGLNTERFQPTIKPASQSAGKVRIVSVGRHVEKKGFAYLIRACQQLVENGVDFQLDIIGEPGDQTGHLVDAIERLALGQRVRLHEPVAQQELARFYNEADVFVLPCIIVDDGDRDGIPNVMAEAMACGLPVVVSAISGIPELVEHNQNGILVPEKNVEALAAAIEALSLDAPRRSRLGQAARKTVETSFDATVTHETLRQVFQRALDQRHVCY